MAFLDKVRAQAEAALSQAQAGMAQGQARLDDYSTGRARADLLRNLGLAVWAERRQGAPATAVDAALAAIDSYDAANPQQGSPFGAGGPFGQTAPGQPPMQPAQPAYGGNPQPQTDVPQGMPPQPGNATAAGDYQT